MAFSYQQKKAHRSARSGVMLDIIRAQHAPVKEPDALYTSILAFVTTLGLPESDAIWFFRTMQRNQWLWQGIPITNWQETVQRFFNHRFFPSQR